MPQCVTSSHTRLFADDCLIYKEIWSQVDADELQADLDALQEWEQQWIMSFHPQKGQLLRITRKKSSVKASYVIYGHTLAETDTAKYLGVSLHKHWSWSPHVKAAAKKANGTRAFLQRNLRKAPTAVKTHTYESIIRPILEYSGVAQDVNRPEMVQHWYTRYTSRDYGQTSSVTAILKTLGWEPLAERRVKARITMMYRIVHGLVDILASDHIIQAPASTRNGNAQFRVPYAQTLAYQRGIFPTARTCGTPSQMKQKASTPLGNGSPSFASDVEITPAPCYYPLLYIYAPVPWSCRHIQPHTHTVRDTLVGSCTISEEEPTAPAVSRPWLKPNEYYRGGDYI